MSNDFQKIPFFKLIAKYYLLFLSVNIFLPKIDLGFGAFYIFDFINLTIFCLLILLGRFYKHISIQTYIIFMAICAVSFFAGLLYYKVFDFSSFARLIKFIFFIFYLIIPYFLFRYVSRIDLMRIIKWQYIFIVLAGSWVIFNMITKPLPLHRYIWDYNNNYRLVGFTGYTIDFSGDISMDGTTSVSMGVFVSLMFLIFLSLYHFEKRKRYLFITFSLVLFEMLTYSRAGILVMATGILYYILLNPRVKILLTLVVIGLLTPVASAFGLFEKLSSFGGLAKIFSIKSGSDGSINTRIDMLATAYNYVKANPETLIWGTGNGEIYTTLAIGYPHLEGLLPTTLFTTGIIAVLILCLHFYSLWHTSTLYSRDRSSNYVAFMYALRLFIPGWFFSSIVAGNTFQTDFYFPFIYFLFFVSYFYLKSEQAYHGSIQQSVL